MILDSIKYFDAHSHLNFEQYNEDRGEVIAEMKKDKIATITVGTNEKTSRESIELAQQHEGIWATVGVHPTEAEEGFDETTYADLVDNSEVVGVGECGFDFYHGEDEDLQQEVFERQVSFAEEHDLPLMLHCRPSEGTQDAYEKALTVLESIAPQASNLRGNVHFFVGNKEVAERFLDLGFTLSFTGIITFVREFDEVIRFAPLDRILVETDAPFAAPEPYRGKRNEPPYVKEVVRALQGVREEDREKIREKLVENTARVFNL